MMKRTPKEVTPRTTDVTGVSTSHRHREGAHPNNNSAPRNINDSDSNMWSRYHTMIPYSSRCRFWLRSMANHHMSTETYRSNHCFPNVARKAARVAYRIR